MKQICIGIHVRTEPERLPATLASLRASTPQTAEVVILPNGVDTAMRAALAALQEPTQVGSVDSIGLPACFNHLIQYSDADVVVFLESGSLVGPGWLDHLLAALDADPSNGLTGPSTNLAWNKQSVFRGTKDTPAEVARTAQEAARRFGSSLCLLEPLHSLADFCYVVKREVIEVIGGADELYGVGPCWEMDYNIRAARAGFKGVWACGAYVHRLPLTFKRMQEEAHLLETNKRLYQDKFCRLSLEGRRDGYCRHCKGEECQYFAPKDLIQIRLPLAEQSEHIRTKRPAIDGSEQTHSLRHFPVMPIANQKAEPLRTATENKDYPLISCIMPTYNRRPYVAQAIEYFLRQSYPNAELIIVDDGTDSIQDLVPLHPRIRYIRLSTKKNLGAKRNLACEEAKGEIVAHWDDDDWMAHWRLTYQVETLLRERADICGLDKLFFYDPTSDQSWQYVYPKGGKLWAAGGTLCYTKAFWRGNPFPDTNAGEDTRFVWSNHSKRMIILQDNTFYVALIHPGNTSPKRTRDSQWHSYPLGELKKLMNEDLAFYTDPLQDKQKQATPEIEPEVSRTYPLVSCIMPTYNRRAFVLRAVHYFLRQDYPKKELIVVDDGTDSVSDLMPNDPCVRYLRIDKKQTLGTKRNLAVRASRGEFVVHWDDDDWYARTRLTEQIQKILQNEADVVALSMRYVLSLPSMEFWRCQPELHARLHYMDLCPGTIAYRRRLWERYGPYPEAPIAWGEDVLFLKALPPASTRICRLPDEELFLCVRHQHNTWPIVLDGSRRLQGWQRIPPLPFLPETDYQGYMALAQNTEKRGGQSLDRAVYE